MSIVSNRHNVNLFVAGKSEALSGQRLAKIGYKKTKENQNPLKSVCVSVPSINMTEYSHMVSAGVFNSIIQCALENAQDGIIRSLYESSEGNLTTVSDEEISVNACINYINAENAGGRLTKEYLENWFANNISDNLSVIIADKLGFDMSTEEQLNTIGKHLNMYKGLISSLAGNKTILQPQQINACKRAIEVSSIDDDTSKKLLQKLANMSPKKLEELLEL